MPSYSVKYVSAQNVELDLSNPPFIWVNTDLLNYEWDYSFVNNANGYGAAIKNIRKNGRSMRIELNIYNDNLSEITSIINYLSQIFETDLLAETPGKLYFNNSYVQGYFIKSEKPTIIAKRFAQVVLTFITGSPLWISEELLTFAPLTVGASTGFILPTALPMTIAAPNARQLINDHYAACSSIITMYGPTTDPEFALGTHTYKVTGSLGAGERFEIDQVKRKVTKITSSGEQFNFFYARGKEYSVFDPVPAGENVVTSNNDFTFSILLLKERSEPIWG